MTVIQEPTFRISKIWEVLEIWVVSRTWEEAILLNFHRMEKIWEVWASIRVKYFRCSWEAKAGLEALEVSVREESRHKRVQEIKEKETSLGISEVSSSMDSTLMISVVRVLVVSVRTSNKRQSNKSDS